MKKSARNITLRVLRSSNLHQVLADDYRSLKMHASRIDPHLVGDSRIIGRSQMRKYEPFDARRLSNPASVLGCRVTSEDMLPEPRWAGGPGD